MRRLIIGMFLVAGLLAGLAGWLMLEYQRFRQAPMTEVGAVNLWLDHGTSFQGMVRKLERLGLTRFDWRWRVLGRVDAPILQAGEYRIRSGTSISEFVEQVVEGRVRKHRFTIVEGWTVGELRSELTADQRLRKIAADWSEAQLMEQLGCSGCNAEGRFLPETYFFVRGSSDLDLLERAHGGMTEALEAAWAGRQPDLPLADAYELLVLASLIERETGQPDERSRIAGVFVRRLERGMRLQTDPTVAYGLSDEFDGRLRRVHLRTDHPWNTYTRHGLPPTPIALPGRASLEAAAHPAEGTALYFVSRGDGSHQFSDTLAEHNAAVDRFIRGQR